MLWVSYGHVMGILWYNKYIHSAKYVHRQELVLIWTREDAGVEKKKIRKNARALAYMKYFLYLCSRFRKSDR